MRFSDDIPCLLPRHNLLDNKFFFRDSKGLVGSILFKKYRPFSLLQRKSSCCRHPLEFRALMHAPTSGFFLRKSSPSQAITTEEENDSYTIDLSTKEKSVCSFTFLSLVTTAAGATTRGNLLYHTEYLQQSNLGSSRLALSLALKKNRLINKVQIPLAQGKNYPS